MQLSALLLPVFLVVPSAAVAQSAPAPASSDYVRFDHLRYRDRVESDGSLERAHEVSVLLRDGAAVAQFGQIVMPFVDGNGEVVFEDVIIEKADGRRIEVKNGLLEEINPFGVSGSSVAADVRFKKLTVPGLEPGDRLAFRAVLKQKPLVPGRIFGEMKFPGTVSDPLQEYELDLPRDAGAVVELDETLGVAWEILPGPADRIVRRLRIRPQRPDFGAEGPTESQVDALQRPDVAFTNFRSWPEVGEWWWNLSKDRLTPDATVRAEAARIVAGKVSPRDKLDALHAFVATRIRYLNVSFGIGRMQPRPAAAVLLNKYGDCKDKVALLAALASAVGIDVRPVLVHSARRTLQDGVPGPQQFDHMIGVAQLGPDAKDWVWLDATNELGLPGYLLRALRDKPALLIEPTGKGRLVRTPELAPFPQRVEVDMKGTLLPDGPLRAHVRWTFRSDSEVEMRLGYRTTPQDRYPEVVKETLARDWKDATVTNVSTSDPSDLKEPFRVEFDVERTPADRSATSEWALSIPFPDFGLPAGRKQATGDEKIANFGLQEFDTRAEIELPRGATGRAPVPVSLDRPFAQLRSEYAVAGPLLKARRRLVLLKRAVTANESAMYESFRQALDKDRAQDFWIQPARDAAAVPPSAAELHKEGLAALQKKDHARAIAVFEKAVAADPKLANGFNDLGRALRDAGRHEEALAAFARQIENDPFHDSVYAERAYILLDRERTAEAEKDLLKQIEVSPLKAWSYERLAELRMDQARFDDAARYYAGAASLEPKKTENWVKLGWAHAAGKRAGEALAAFERARGLDPPDWLAVRLALGFHVAGDLKAAGEVAEQAIPRLAERVAALTGARFGAGDVYWTARLFEAWQTVGVSAAAAGDMARAERHLDAAWRAGFQPMAAWYLGMLREKQHRPDDAARLWDAAAAFGNWEAVQDWLQVPAAVSKRMAAAGAERRRMGGTEALMALRTVTLAGPPAEDFTSDVVVLFGPDGKVEGVKNLSSKNQAAFDRVLPQLRSIKVPFPRPDERAVKMVRRGIVVCNRQSTCAMVFDIPGVDTGSDR